MALKGRKRVVQGQLDVKTQSKSEKGKKKGMGALLKHNFGGGKEKEAELAKKLAIPKGVSLRELVRQGEASQVNVTVLNSLMAEVKNLVHLQKQGAGLDVPNTISGIFEAALIGFIRTTEAFDEVTKAIEEIKTSMNENDELQQKIAEMNTKNKDYLEKLEAKSLELLEKKKGTAQA